MILNNFYFIKYKCNKSNKNNLVEKKSKISNHLYYKDYFIVNISHKSYYSVLKGSNYHLCDNIFFKCPIDFYPFSKLFQLSIFILFFLSSWVNPVLFISYLTFFYVVLELWL